MIAEKQAEAANDFIRDKAGEYAQARANRIYLEQFRKSKKALLMNERDGPEHVRTSYAYAHADYLGVLAGLKAAVEVEEELRWKMIAAQAKIEIWRTQQANQRQGM